MHKSVDISIIIVNWNTKQILLDCLKSLTKENILYKHEIILVDNGSSDGSQAAVRASFPAVQIIENNANLGFAKANNIGMKVSKGKYLCLINSDVQVLDDCLSKMFQYMENQPHIGILGPKIFFPDMRTQCSCREFPSLWNNFCPVIGLNNAFPQAKCFHFEYMTYFNHDEIRKIDYLAGCCFFIRRSALDQVGLFDEQFFIYSEEIDLCKRFWHAGWEVVFYPNASIIHHHGASSSKDPLRFSGEQIKSKVKYWKKHHSKIATTTFLLIYFLDAQRKFKLHSRCQNTTSA
jgi:hypothetical protein